MQILISILAYVVAVGILVTIHEFGHFIVARRLGIKVLRFSIGFGKPLYTWHRKGDETDYVIAAIPLGGYVKMSDEREGTVEDADLPRAFNRQSIPRRFAVVVAGPAFNLLLAVLAYWIIFMIGVSSLRPVVAYVTPDSIAAQAGVRSGDQILSISGSATPTWDEVQLDLFREVLRSPNIPLTVKGPDGQRNVTLVISDPQKLTEPNQMLNGLGLSVVPQIPVVGQLAAGDAAATAGLKVGDRIVSVDGAPVASWLDMVRILKASAGKTLALVVSRGGKELDLILKVGTITNNGVKEGHVGVGGPLIPDGYFDSLKVEQRYNPLAALGHGLERTAEMSWLTLVAGWNMLIGNVSLKNLSGPIDIAQYAGYAAEGGVASFLEFLAFVSISLGVLNLLPIPVLDGGHLLYFVAEGVKGAPLSERTEALGQKVGIMLLLALMGFAVCNDLIRVFS